VRVFECVIVYVRAGDMVVPGNTLCFVLSTYHMNTC